MVRSFHMQGAGCLLRTTKAKQGCWTSVLYAKVSLEKANHGWDWRGLSFPRWFEGRPVWQNSLDSWAEILARKGGIFSCFVRFALCREYIEPDPNSTEASSIRVIPGVAYRCLRSFWESCSLVSKFIRISWRFCSYLAKESAPSRSPLVRSSPIAGHWIGRIPLSAQHVVTVSRFRCRDRHEQD